MPETKEAQPEEKTVKVTMLDGGYDQTHGKFRKGGVYEFGQEQAIRYVRSGMAKAAPASAKTAREEDREVLQRDWNARAKSDQADAEMAAAWDIDVRDLERAEFEAAAAEEASKAADAAVTRAKSAQKQIGRPTGTSGEPHEVTSQGEPIG